jgi:hypothetical protein
MKNSLLLLVGLICSITAMAQVTGIKGGVNISDVSTISGTDRIGAYVGFYYRTPVRKHWSIQPEIWYASEGERYSTIAGDQVLALSYVKVPVMFQYHAGKQVYLELGPQLGLLTSANIKNSNGDRANVIGSYNRLAMGLGFGLGIQASKELTLNGRYNVGLTDITANNNSVSYSNQLQLGVGIRIR